MLAFVSTALTVLDVRSNSNIAGDSASQLSAAVLASPKIETFNDIPIKEMRTNTMNELSLQNKNIGVVGAMVVAGLLPAMTALTRVDVIVNSIGEEGKSVLRQAVEGRAGFDLNCPN